MQRKPPPEQVLPANKNSMTTQCALKAFVRARVRKRLGWLT